MTRIYWDSCTVIYRVQDISPWARAIAAKLDRVLDSTQLYVSPLTRLECRVFPIRMGNLDLLTRFDGFFARPEVRLLDLTPPVIDLATELRASHALKTPDALHLAAALAAGCHEFWTNDRRLERAATGRIQVVAVDDLP